LLIASLQLYFALRADADGGAAREELLLLLFHLALWHNFYASNPQKNGLAV
jgi:hypothetical protein